MLKPDIVKHIEENRDEQTRGLHPAKKLLHGEGSSQRNEKATYGMGKSIWIPYIW